MDVDPFAELNRGVATNPTLLTIAEFTYKAKRF